MKTLENLTVKFINQEATLHDLEQLYGLLKSPENEKRFKSFIRINFYSIYLMNEIDKTDIIKALEQKIKAKKNKLQIRRLILEPLKYAAIAVLFLSLGYYYHLSTTQIISDEQPLIKKDQVVLKTSAGESYVLDSDQNIEIEQELNLTKNSNEIDYKSAEENPKDQYHSLYVPYGKRYNILLSDGTKVYLNAGSSLKYPVVFPKGQTRKVELQGEAFFDVTESSSLFVVQSTGLSVEVYGTTFNFKNYQEDPFSDVVLVQGSVGLNTGGDNPVYKLSPGHKGSLLKDKKSISTERVNTKLYTSWINGEIVIRKEAFDQIVAKLERIYNVSIINNKATDGQLFNANINPEVETIEEVLMYFKEIYQIEYKIYGNKIIIN